MDIKIPIDMQIKSIKFQIKSNKLELLFQIINYGFMEIDF